MSIEEKINSVAKLEFKRTEEPYDYRYGLYDDQLDLSAFCCEIERVNGFKAEDVFKILKSSIIETPANYLSALDEFPIQYILDIQDAIIKLDDFIKIKKTYMQKNLG